MTAAANGLDDGVWQLLCDAVAAVHNGDAAEAHAATDRIARRVPFNSEPALYMWWLLRYIVAEMVGHRPSAGELAQLAETVKPKAMRVIPDPAVVHNTLLTVWKLATEAQTMAEGRLLVGMIIALGVLLDEPGEQMEAARHHLANWWARSRDEYEARGFLDDRSTAEARRRARPLL